MLSSPATLLIGAAGRNVGKTEFACALIRRFSASRPVIGLKITTVTACDGLCPRGGKGCGVCSSLKGDFDITEERSPDGGKDTARMLASGAQKVFWLRVLRDHMASGLAALYHRIPEEALVVCESNSAREALLPGLFLVIREAGSATIKESCANVIRHADRVLEFHGNGWSLDPSRIAFGSRGWQLGDSEEQASQH